MELSSRGMIALTFFCFFIACKGKAVLDERPNYYGGYEYNYNFQNDQHDVRPLYDYSQMLSSEQHQPQRSGFNLPNSYDEESDDMLENYYIPKKIDSIYGGIKTSHLPEFIQDHASTSAKFYDDDYDTPVVPKKNEPQCYDCFEDPVVITRKKHKPTRKSKPAKFLYQSDKDLITNTYSDEVITECEDCTEEPVVIRRQKTKPTRKVKTAISVDKSMYSNDYDKSKVASKKKQADEFQTECADCYEDKTVVKLSKSEVDAYNMNLPHECDDCIDVPVIEHKTKTTDKLNKSAVPSKTIYGDNNDNLKVVSKKHSIKVQTECTDCYEEPVVVERKKSEDVYKNPVSSEINVETECEDCTELPVVIGRRKAKPTRKANKHTTEDLYTEDYLSKSKKPHSGKTEVYAAPEDFIIDKSTGIQKMNKNENSIQPADYKEFDSLNVVKKTKNNVNYAYNGKPNLKLKRSDDFAWIDESKGPDLNVLDLTAESEDDLDEQFLDIESLNKKKNEKSECSVQSKSSNKKPACVDHKKKPEKRKPEVIKQKPQKPEVNKQKPEKQKPEVNKQKPEIHKQKQEVYPKQTDYEKPVKVSHVKYGKPNKVEHENTKSLYDVNEMDFENGISDTETVGLTKLIPKQKCTNNVAKTSNGEMETCKSDEKLSKPLKSQSYMQNIQSKFPEPSDDEYVKPISKYGDAAYSEVVGSKESFDKESDLSVVEPDIIGNEDVQMDISQDNEPFENVGSGSVAEDGIEKIPDMSDGSDKLRSLSSNILPLLFNPDTRNNDAKPCVTRNNESGFCRYVQQCQVPDIATSLEKLLNNACVVDDVFIGVCCPEFPVETVRVHWDESENTAIDTDDDDDDEEAFRQEIDDCGTRSKEALGNQSWPWKAPLVSMSNGKIFCGGIVIGTEYVLTAAHCTTKIPRNQILVRIGQHDESSGEDFIVTKIKRHARYNSRTLQNDIALLKLGRRIPVSQHSGIICLPEEDNHEVKGDTAFLLGWKGIFGENPHTGEALEIMPMEKCRSMMNTNVPDSVLCTEARKDAEITCNADSGAPLVIEQGDKYEVIGILSWNRNDCDPRFPTIFSRVSSYVKWIKQHAV